MHRYMNASLSSSRLLSCSLTPYSSLMSKLCLFFPSSFSPLHTPVADLVSRSQGPMSGHFPPFQFFFFFKYIFIFTCLFACLEEAYPCHGVCGGQRIMCMKLFYHVGPGGWTQVIRLSSTCLGSLSPLASPSFPILDSTHLLRAVSHWSLTHHPNLKLRWTSLAQK